MIAFAEEVVARGFTLIMPSLFGRPEAASTVPGSLRSIATICVSKEFSMSAGHCFRAASGEQHRHRSRIRPAGSAHCASEGAIGVVPTERRGAPADRRRKYSTNGLRLVVLGLLIAARGAGVLIGRATPDTAVRPQGLASTAITHTLAKRIDALNAGDLEKLASFYAPNAILEERDVEPAITTRGARRIAERLRVFAKEFGFQLGSESAAIQYGPYVAEAAKWAGEPRMLMYAFDSSGLITHQWVLSALENA